MLGKGKKGDWMRSKSVPGKGQKGDVMRAKSVPGKGQIKDWIKELNLCWEKGK